MALDIAKKLMDINAVKFGDFTLASGAKSHVYIDLRQLVSYPSLLDEISVSMWEKIQHLDIDLLCGVPYTALPMATAISLKQNLPMLMVRKEPKDYGTKRMVEGSYQAGQRCLIVEDVATSGGSIIKAVKQLREQGLEVTDAVVLVDREAGASNNLHAEGVNLHAVYTLSELGVLDNVEA